MVEFGYYPLFGCRKNRPRCTCPWLLFKTIFRITAPFLNIFSETISLKKILYLCIYSVEKTFLFTLYVYSLYECEISGICAQIPCWKAVPFTSFPPFLSLGTPFPYPFPLPPPPPSTSSLTQIKILPTANKKIYL